MCIICSDMHRIFIWKRETLGSSQTSTGTYLRVNDLVDPATCLKLGDRASATAVVTTGNS